METTSNVLAHTQGSSSLQTKKQAQKREGIQRVLEAGPYTFVFLTWTEFLKTSFPRHVEVLRSPTREQGSWRLGRCVPRGNSSQG